MFSLDLVTFWVGLAQIGLLTPAVVQASGWHGTRKVKYVLRGGKINVTEVIEYITKGRSTNISHLELEVK